MDFPKYSADLLRLLDKEIPKPYWPTTAGSAAQLTEEQIRKNLWFAAQRALVESLLLQVETEEEQDETDETDPYSDWSANGGPRVLPTAGNMVERTVTSVAGLGTTKS